MIFLKRFHLLTFRIRSYFTYLAKRTDAHGLHPPFVFNLYTQTLSENRQFYAFNAIEDLRNELLRDNTTIEVEDFGAGNLGLRKNSSRTISSVAKQSTKPASQARMLFRLAEMSRPNVCVELGTNLGLTTAYLAAAVSPSRVISIEGAPELANLASENLQKLDLNNVEIRINNFDVELPEILNIENPDFFFIDGNHTKEATLRYWQMIVAHLKPNSVVVFDDIHWSKGMEEAWNEILNDKAIKLSLDFYCMGVLLFREGLTRQHFVLKMPR